MKHKGFTVVELIVVVVVIVILATITVVSYSFVREDAMDTKIKATVKTVGDAIQLHESKTGSRIAGGPFFSDPNGVDSLVPDYLKPGYRDGITSKNASADPVYVFRMWTCNNGTGGFIIYASLNNPTTEDISNFTSLRSSCGHSVDHMPGATYNYAQIF